MAGGAPVHTVMDQLWLGNQGYRPPRAPEPVAAAAEPPPLHLAIPGQRALFPAPTRDWQRLRGQPLPALTPTAQELVDDLDRKARAESWDKGTRLINVRVLRMALSHLGAEAPVLEEDIRAIAKLGTNFAGLRGAHFLEACRLLEPRPGREIGMDQAAVARLAATAPECFRAEIEAWIRVLRGEGRRRSVPIEWVSIRRYVGYVLPVLTEWGGRFDTLKQVAKDDIVAAVTARPSSPGRAVHSGLRSLFRALKRERLIFHDPARNVHLGGKVSVPRPVPSDRIAGMLDKVPTSYGKLIVALVAIHAVRPLQLPGLLLADLDRSRGRLLVGKRIVYLDDLTLKLIADSLADRHRRWPCGSNPHLLVSRRTAMNAEHPPVSKYSILYQFKHTRLGPQQVWIDRILHEAEHTEDPLHLMRVFDLSVTTAVKYVQAAHPERCITEPTRA